MWGHNLITPDGYLLTRDYDVDNEYGEDEISEFSVPPNTDERAFSLLLSALKIMGSMVACQVAALLFCEYIMLISDISFEDSKESLLEATLIGAVNGIFLGSLAVGINTYEVIRKRKIEESGNEVILDLPTPFLKNLAVLMSVDVTGKGVGMAAASLLEAMGVVESDCEPGDVLKAALIGGVIAVLIAQFVIMMSVRANTARLIESFQLPDVIEFDDMQPEAPEIISIDSLSDDTKNPPQDALEGKPTSDQLVFKESQSQILATLLNGKSIGELKASTPNKPSETNHNVSKQARLEGVLEESLNEISNENDQKEKQKEIAQETEKVGSKPGKKF